LRRNRAAEEGFEAMKSIADVTLVIRHEDIPRMMSPKDKSRDALDLADDTFALAIEGILELKKESGSAKPTKGIGSCYFDGYPECLKILIPQKAFGYFGAGGGKRLAEAMEKAVTCPLLAKDLAEANQVLLHMPVLDSTELEEIDKARAFLKKRIPGHVEVYSGVSVADDEAGVFLYALNFLCGTSKN
jgi:cell division GTPase FtsZ